MFANLSGFMGGDGFDSKTSSEILAEMNDKKREAFDREIKEYTDSDNAILQDSTEFLSRNIVKREPDYIAKLCGYLENSRLVRAVIEELWAKRSQLGASERCMAQIESRYTEIENMQKTLTKLSDEVSKHISDVNNPIIVTLIRKTKALSDESKALEQEALRLGISRIVTKEHVAVSMTGTTLRSPTTEKINALARVIRSL